MNRKILIVLFMVALVIEIPLIILGLELVTVMIVTFVAVMAGYFIWWGVLNKRLNDTLDEKCDPQKFIDKCEKTKSISKRMPFQNFCNVNIAVGLISLGRYNEALEILLQKIDLEVKNSKMLIAAYHLAVFCCYIDIEDMGKATYEYEKYLKEIRKITIHPKLVFAIDTSFFDYQYKLNKTAETAKVFLEQLEYLHNIYSNKISKRSRLNILYNKASLLYMLGDYKAAAEKYKIVAENGNSLYIAEISKTKLKEIETLNAQ